MRQIKTIKLPVSNYEVEIPTYLTWGEREDIQALMLNGVELKASGVDGFKMESLKASQRKTLEIAVKKITLEGKEIAYSEDWLKELPASDGDFLYAEINEIDKKK